MSPSRTLQILFLVATLCAAIMHVEAQAFSCSNWDSYTNQQFGNMATTGIIGENGRKCRISTGGRGASCNYYVKYDIDGNSADNWTGMSFQGVPGAGTGCCSSISSCRTLAGAGAWLKSRHKDICCGAPVFSCSSWVSYTNQQFGTMATTGIIGENGRKCRISTGGLGAACNYYVKYDIDGNSADNWTGMSFQGVPGAGTGCCSSTSSCRTLAGAGAWLKSRHKDICCGAPVFSCSSWDSYTNQQFGTMATTGIIGENGRKCRISTGGRGAACNYYVKYDIDGNSADNWTGMSFQGVPGAGTGCCSSISSCRTLAGAGAWLKSRHRQICCGGPIYG